MSNLQQKAMVRMMWRLQLFLVPAVLVATAGVGEARSTIQPPIRAKAAIVVNHRTGEVLFARNPDLQLPPASTTKVMTALVAVREGELDRNVRVSKRASRAEPTKIWLRPGWVMNVEDLLYAALLNSANDASIVLAEGLGGSVSGFAQKMNETAREIGATRSHFVNPNGLPADGHYSTARDLATIMHHALQRPLLRNVLTTRAKVIRPQQGAKRKIALRSHNRYLTRAERPVIGKTGWTRRAKRCFVGAAREGEDEILVSLLGSTDLWGDLDLLVDYGFASIRAREWPVAAGGWQEAHVARQATNPQETEEEGAPWEAARARSPMGDAPDSPVVERAAPRPRFRYHVYVASFRSRTRADRLRREVVAQGYAATVEQLQGKKRPVYRVSVRDFANREAARRAVVALRKAHRVEPLIVAVRA